MSELVQFILGHDKQFRRLALLVKMMILINTEQMDSQRLPSLYSDFTPQRYSNPDGYAANTTAWINALATAAQAGALPANGKNRDTLLLRTGDFLLRSLETKECGTPLALGTVIVGWHAFSQIFD